MQNSKPISEYTDIELKSFGYDLINQIESLNQNLMIIRNELNRRSQDVKATVSQSEYNKITSNAEFVKNEQLVK